MMGGLSCHMSRQKSTSVCGSGPAWVWKSTSVYGCMVIHTGECVCMHGNGSGPVKPGLKYDAGAYEADGVKAFI